jgi:hypothetical protein
MKLVAWIAVVAVAGCGKHDDAQERLGRASEQARGSERA